MLAKLEQRLLAAHRVEIEARIEARGALTANLAGRGEWREGNVTTVAFAGKLGGAPSDVALSADGHALQMQHNAHTRRSRVAAETNRALLVGFARMGLMHNVARLTGLQEPDRAGGGVADWARLDSFRPTTFAQAGPLEGLMSLGFDLVIDEVASPVQLWLDPVTQLPKRRQLTVRFGDGEMTVVEDYLKFVVE